MGEANKSRVPWRRRLRSMAWQREVMKRCPSCGGHNIGVYTENPHCFECGGELVFARENKQYGLFERCCSECGVIDHTFHYIFRCEDCGEEHRIRIGQDGQVEWKNRIFGGVATSVSSRVFHDCPTSHLVEPSKHWETSAPLFLKSNQKLVVCRGCGRIFSINPKEKNFNCPHCRFAVPVRDYVQEVYGEHHPNRVNRVNDLERLLPISVSQLAGLSCGCRGV